MDDRQLSDVFAKKLRDYFNRKLVTVVVVMGAEAELVVVVVVGELLQTNKMHTLIYNFNNVLIYKNCYMFRSSLVHHQGVCSCIKHTFDLIIISSMWNCRTFIYV